MPALRIEASAVLAAPAPAIYGLIADYHEGHPSILPPEYFAGLAVEEGGRGAGTRIRFTMKALGGRRESWARVTEPEPGRVLVEAVEGQGRGWLERFVVPPYLKRVYAAQLRLLEQRAAGTPARA